ncbi:hypothetical protein J5Y17_04185 [Celeribacter sp. PS-C1]|nr:hypothetical protein [Celeribacter sp. PS-C1]
MLQRAQIAGIFLGPADGTLLSLGTYIDGLAYGVKSGTVFGENPDAGLPTAQGAMLIFEPQNGRLEAILDSRLICMYR